MDGTNRDVTTWRKSSYSGGNGGDCLEVAETVERVLIRDTKDRAGAVIAVPADAWRKFTSAVK
jgi:hypothetical protein